MSLYPLFFLIILHLSKHLSQQLDLLHKQFIIVAQRAMYNDKIARISIFARGNCSPIFYFMRALACIDPFGSCFHRILRGLLSKNAENDPH